VNKTDSHGCFHDCLQISTSMNVAVISLQLSMTLKFPFRNLSVHAELSRQS